MKISLYLAGKIQKSHEPSNEARWTEEDLKKLREAAPDLDLIFLNPAIRTDDLSDSKSVFGRDMTQVFSSDIILVDARDRRGLGVGAEMMFAKFNHIPIITLAPHNTHYRKDKAVLLGVDIEDFVHPFVQELSDVVAGSLEEMGEAIMRFAGDEAFPKGPEWITETMDYYQKTQMGKDLPMRELFESHSFLKERLLTSY